MEQWPAIPQEEFSYLEVIERNGKNLLALINDLLDLARIESGKDELHIDYFSVSELLNEIITMVDPQAREKCIEILQDVKEGLPHINSDYKKCRHILQNIIANAVKFTLEGKVEITATPLGDSIQIVISDTGIGISGEHIPYIFDEFRQADGSASRKHGGTGLGLAIAKKSANLIGASISVESVPGKGSTFTVKLPLRITNTHGEPATPKTATLHSNSSTFQHPPHQTVRGKHILLVEDSEPAIVQIVDMLSLEGYQVHIARSGKEALEYTSNHTPDAMILDLMMPEIDGFQVLKKVREAFKTANLPILILTAKQVSHEELSFLKGNNVYQLIQKGDVSKKDLLNLVAQMVSSQFKTIRNRAIRRRHPIASNKPIVLVVEDNPDNLITLKALLKDSVTLIEASDGQSGIILSKEQKPDIILLDIALPDIDGFTVLAEIRKIESLQNIPVIALTARAMKGDPDEILSHGFDGYISKPIDSQRLTTILEEVLYGS